MPMETTKLTYVKTMTFNEEPNDKVQNWNVIFKSPSKREKEIPRLYNVFLFPNEAIVFERAWKNSDWSFD